MLDAVVLPAAPDVTAPDGSDVRILAGTAGGTMAHFTLAPGAVTIAVVHRTVEELWFVVAGSGELWRATGEDGGITPLLPGTSVGIPVATRFQFRATGDRPLDIVAVTMPPWPGDGEATRCDGPWTPTVAPGPGLAPATSHD